MSLDAWSLGSEADDLDDFEYLEPKESGKESYSANSSNANRVFLVRWDNRASFLNDLLGWAYIDNSNEIKRTLPDSHPAIANFWASEASLEGQGALDLDDDNNMDWTVARIQCTYKPCDYDLLEDADIDTELDRFVTRKATFNANFLSTQGFMKFNTPLTVGGKDDPGIVEIPPNVITGDMALEYVWHQVPGNSDMPFITPNFNAINACIGRTNSTIFDPNGYALPVGTVLFIGMNPKMETPKLADDLFYWEITHQFIYRNNGIAMDAVSIAGHNYIFRPRANAFDLLVNPASGATLYPLEEDLNTLFTVA